MYLIPDHSGDQILIVFKHKKLTDVVGKGQYYVEISNKFATVENLNTERNVVVAYFKALTSYCMEENRAKLQSEWAVPRLRFKLHTSPIQAAGITT